MYFGVYMFGVISWETHGRHSDQMLAPMCRITVTVMAADADGYRCAYSQLKSINSDVIF